jgi:hypothetical protein
MPFTTGDIGGCCCGGGCGCQPCELPESGLTASGTVSGNAFSFGLTWSIVSLDCFYTNFCSSVNAGANSILIEITCTSPGTNTHYRFSYYNGPTCSGGAIKDLFYNSSTGSGTLTLSSYTCSPVSLSFTASGVVLNVTYP